MFFYLEGILKSKGKEDVVLDCGGFGFRVVLSEKAIGQLPKVGEKVKIFTSFFFKENQPFQVFGFLSELELRLFEVLISVSGIGPKTAMAILSQTLPEEIIWAIGEGQSDFLEKVSGIGKKTAQKIILELQSKINLIFEKSKKEGADEDLEVIEALSSLGFSKSQIREALNSLDPSIKGIESKLKEVLKVLGKNKIQ